jgi:hypothetical protein
MLGQLSINSNIQCIYNKQTNHLSQWQYKEIYMCVYCTRYCFSNTGAQCTMRTHQSTIPHVHLVEYTLDTVVFYNNNNSTIYIGGGAITEELLLY